MRVTILPGRKTREVEAGDVAQLLKRLSFQPDAWLVIRDQEILTRDVKLQPADAVEVWPVISGG